MGMNTNKLTSQEDKLYIYIGIYIGSGSKADFQLDASSTASDWLILINHRLDKRRAPSSQHRFENSCKPNLVSELNAVSLMVFGLSQ